MIPAGRNQHNFASLIPGMTGPSITGARTTSILNMLFVHGSRAEDQRVMVDGMSISATSGDGQLTNFMPDMTSTQEVAVSYSAGAAEQAFGGVQMNMIPEKAATRARDPSSSPAVNSSVPGAATTRRN